MGRLARPIERLFQDGVRVDGFEHVLRPSPHHALILLARRHGRGAGRLSDKQRRKVDRSLGGGDGVWDRAAQIAGEWHCRSALRGCDGDTRAQALRAMSACVHAWNRRCWEAGARSG